MSLRFRRSVKIAPGIKLNFSKSGISTTFGGRGFSTTVSKRGIYRNIGIPGTGVSFRKKIAGSSSKGQSTRKKSRGTVASPSAQRATRQGTPSAIQEWIAITGETNPSASISLSPTGEITIEDGTGEPITDPRLISIIKRTPQYKEQMALLVQEQRKEVASKVESYNAATRFIVEIGNNSAKVLQPEQFFGELETLKPQQYEQAKFPEAAPTQEATLQLLAKEAKENIKGWPWAIKSLRQQYIEENLASSFERALKIWQQQKEAFELQEALRADKLNHEFRKEYEQRELRWGRPSLETLITLKSGPASGSLSTSIRLSTLELTLVSTLLLNIVPTLRLSW